MPSPIIYILHLTVVEHVCVSRDIVEKAPQIHAGRANSEKCPRKGERVSIKNMLQICDGNERHPINY